LAKSIALVLRAESILSEPISSIGDNTVLDEVNFAGLIIDKL
jgi:hypothetical protein